MKKIDMKVTDLERFALEQIVRPYQSMIMVDKPINTSPFSLDELVGMLSMNDEWSKLVLDRISKCGFWFPAYVSHRLTKLIDSHNQLIEKIDREG